MVCCITSCAECLSTLVYNMTSANWYVHMYYLPTVRNQLLNYKPIEALCDLCMLISPAREPHGYCEINWGA